MAKLLPPFVRKIARALGPFGISLRDVYFLKNYPKYLRHKREWKRQGGKIARPYMILSDFDDMAGGNRGHYFHQDLLVARYIHEKAPKRHIDVGSRVDGFVAHVASFREIEVLDIRPLPKSVHTNIRFMQADLMEPTTVNETDSLSCLHAIEHFGLGRYSDPIDVDGHLKGITNLVSLVAPGGTLYISFPIGLADEVEFNGQRVFHPESILGHEAIKREMVLENFDYIDDAGDLHLSADLAATVGKLQAGCGIYTFRKAA